MANPDYWRMGQELSPVERDAYERTYHLFPVERQWKRLTPEFDNPSQYSDNDCWTYPQLMTIMSKIAEDMPEGYTMADLRIKSDEGTIYFEFERWETEQEARCRFNMNVAHIRSTMNSERALYEQLKMKYEPVRNSSQPLPEGPVPNIMYDEHGGDIYKTK
jgi:hypothetical protein